MYEGQGDTRARHRALQVGGWQFFFFSSRREISLYMYIYVCVCVYIYIFFFNWRLLIRDFTILWWFLPYIHMNQPWMYMYY